MKCMHCDNNLPDNCEICAFCGKKPSIPDGYRLDTESRLYYLETNSVDHETGAPIRLVTWFNPANCIYTQEKFNIEFSVPDGFVPDKENGLYRMTAETRNAETGEVSRLITLFDPKTGRYSQKLSLAKLDEDEIKPEANFTRASNFEAVIQADRKPLSETETDSGIVQKAQPEFKAEVETQPESKPEPEAQPGSKAEVEAQPESKLEPEAQPESKQGYEVHSNPEEPILKYEQIPDEVPDEPQPPAYSEKNATEPTKKKKRAGRIIALISLLILLGLGGAGYYFGYYERLIELYNATQIVNITSPPEGASVPDFRPVDTEELPPESIIEVPGEVIEIEEDVAPDIPEPAEPITVEPINYYPELPSVNSFSSRAMQDESFIYYLTPNAATGLSELMRVPVSSPKPEYIPNCFPQTASVYSFTLFESDIIVCVKKPETQVYGYYRVPKNGGEAQFLFELNSPSLINWYDGKLFMLFASERKLGIFDIKNDIQPAFIDLNIDSSDMPVYMQEFSVMNGYLYYGLSYNNGARTEYMRRSLYTGETTPIFGSGALNEPWIVNPVWDNSGTVYYGQFNRETGEYSFKTCKAGGAPESLMSFAVSDVAEPLIAALGGSGIIVSSGADSLREYYYTNIGGYDSIDARGGRPYAVTKSYIVAPNAIYSFEESEWIMLEAPDASMINQLDDSALTGEGQPLDNSGIAP